MVVVNDVQCLQLEPSAQQVIEKMAQLIDLCALLALYVRAEVELEVPAIQLERILAAQALPRLVL